MGNGLLDSLRTEERTQDTRYVWCVWLCSTVVCVLFSCVTLDFFKWRELVVSLREYGGSVWGVAAFFLTMFSLHNLSKLALWFLVYLQVRIGSLYEYDHLNKLIVSSHHYIRDGA